MKTLIEHLREINEQARAWVAVDPAKRFASGVIEDLEFWASQGITTVEQYEHQNLVSNVFEATRSLWGYKPSWSALMAQSDAELQAELDSLNAEARRQQEQEQRDEEIHAQAVTTALAHRSGFTIGEVLTNLN